MSHYDEFYEEMAEEARKHTFEIQLRKKQKQMDLIINSDLSEAERATTLTVIKAREKGIL